MSPRPKLAIVALVLAPLFLAGCFADSTPDAQQAYAPSDGVMGDSGSIRVLNAMVVAGENATDGVLSMTIVNRGNETERLVGVDSDAGTVQLSGSAEIAPNRAVAFGSGADRPATIRSLDAEPGETVSLTLRFAGVDTIRLRTLVVPATGEYASLTPSPAGSPAAG